MNVQKIKYFGSRLTQMGLRGLVTWGATKSCRHYFIMRYKKAAQAHQANHQWGKIAPKLKSTSSCARFFTDLASNKIFDRILASEQFTQHFQPTLSNTPILFNLADALCKNQFSVLGSPKINFGKNIPWHCDIKLPQAQWGTEYWNQPNNQFYQEIIAQTPEPQVTKSCDYYPDIKVPWELSRLQHLFTLGRAYQRALSSNNHERASNYSKTFVAHLENWIDNNPYLLGVNWVCPMEVAIRAVNIIWGFSLFKHDQEIPMGFWEKVVCSLYDHMHYLEHNRETSDKPNNHYMADLIGLLYLYLFFKNKNQSTVLNTIWAQVAHQIQPDGTSYEGSTHYHKLVTEMLVHVELICQHQNIPMPSTFASTLCTMKAFLQDCTDLSGNLTQIGDNDSGHFVTGLRINPNTQPRIISYRYAGITIINTCGWLITYRHPTISKNQPTGHFHADELSITISLDGKPLIVDPGSYLYTGNSTLRNQLRSPNAHNTYFVPAFEQEPKHLFMLPRTPDTLAPEVTMNGRMITICNRHLKYSHKGLEAYRKLIFDPLKETLDLHDWWQPIDGHQNQFSLSQAHNCVWNIHWAPDISLYQNEPHSWIISRKNKPIAHLTSTLSFTSCTDFFSPHYGVREPSITLTATHPLSRQHRSIKIHRF